MNLHLTKKLEKIAEFMDIKVHRFEVEGLRRLLLGSEEDEDWECLVDYNPKNDWNALMDIVDKIENLEKDKFDLGSYTTMISNTQGHYFEVRLRDDYNEKIADGWGTKKKNVVFYGCLDFIEWYNETK